MSQNINFIRNWGEDRLNSWSGTPFHLYQALSKQATVNDISIVFSKFDNVERKNRIFNNYIRKTDNFGLTDLRIEERHLKKKKLYGPSVVFQEYGDIDCSNMYLYIDCSVDFVVRLNKNKPELSKYTPYGINKKQKVVEQRLSNSFSFQKRCSGIFTMSRWLCNDLTTNSHIPEEKVHWVGGGYNVDLSKIDYSQKNGKRFLFIGRDWERKNGPLVVSAFRDLLKKYTDLELYVAGPSQCPFEQSDHIYYLGNLNSDELVKYYNLCDYFVMPSRFEAYGIVFAEALLFGLPCIGTNCFAMPEFISPDENGYLIKENSVDELCDAMELLLINHDRLTNNVVGKRKYYEEYYSWDSVAKRMIKIMIEDGFDVLTK